MPCPGYHAIRLLIGSTSLLAALMAGCAGRGSHHAAANGMAPGISEDAPSHGRAGTNPNAPFTLIDRTPRPAAQPASLSEQDAIPCSGKELTMTEVAAEANGEAHRVQFAFVNQGSQACKIGGYPSIDLLDEQGQPVASLAVEQTGSKTLQAKTAAVDSDSTANSQAAQIVIEPHGEAFFGVGWITGEDCPVVAKISMTAPGTTQTFTVARALKVCAGQVHVTALRSTQAAS